MHWFSCCSQLLRAVSLTHKLPVLVDALNNPEAKIFLQNLLEPRYAAQQQDIGPNMSALGHLRGAIDEDESGEIIELLRKNFPSYFVKCEVRFCFTRFSIGTDVIYCQDYTRMVRRSANTVLFTDPCTGLSSYAQIKRAYMVDLTYSNNTEASLPVALGTTCKLLQNHVCHANHVKIVEPFQDASEKILIPLKSIRELVLYMSFSDVEENIAFIAHLPYVNNMV